MNEAQIASCTFRKDNYPKNLNILYINQFSPILFNFFNLVLNFLTIFLFNLSDQFRLEIADMNTYHRMGQEPQRLQIITLRNS